MRLPAPFSADEIVKALRHKNRAPAYHMNQVLNLNQESSKPEVTSGYITQSLQLVAKKISFDKALEERFQ